MVNFGVPNMPDLASFSPTISSALTQPGEPVGKRVFARAASSRAVFWSPRRKPLLVAAYYVNPAVETAERSAVLAEVGRIAASA